MRAENWSISLCTGYGARDWLPLPSRERAGERGLMLAARPFDPSPQPSPTRGEGVKTVWGMPLILRQGSKHQGCKRSSGKRLLHRRLDLVQAAEKPHGLERGFGQMRWRWPQSFSRPGGIPAANVLAFEGTDGLPIDHCHPAGGWLLSPADVCHSAFAWWIGPSVGSVADSRALWTTLIYNINRHIQVYGQAILSMSIPLHTSHSAIRAKRSPCTNTAKSRMPSHSVLAPGSPEFDTNCCKCLICIGQVLKIATTTGTAGRLG